MIFRDCYQVLHYYSSSSVCDKIDFFDLTFRSLVIMGRPIGGIEGEAYHGGEHGSFDNVTAIDKLGGVDTGKLVSQP